MNPTVSFLCGWLFGILIMTCLVLAWYIRARRRMNQIKASILQYQKAQKLMQEAADKAYGKLS